MLIVETYFKNNLYYQLNHNYSWIQEIFTKSNYTICYSYLLKINGVDARVVNGGGL